MDGLKKLVELNGGFDALSAELSTKLRRADLKGASALLVVPYLPFQKRFGNASDVLPAETQTAVTETTRLVLSPCGISTQTINNIISLSIFARALMLAQNSQSTRSIVFDPYAVTEEWQWCQYQFICSPKSLRSRNRHDSNPRSCLGVSSVELALRACAVLYTKEMVFCRDWPRNLSGYSVPLNFILKHVEAICRCSGTKSLADHDSSLILSTNPNSEYGTLAKPVLIWICLFASALSCIANHNEDRHGLNQYDCSMYRACLIDVVGLATKHIDTLSDEDLLLCRILDLRHIIGQEWDDRLGLKRLLDVTLE